MKLIACNSNRPLALALARSLALPLTATALTRFRDEETCVEILEEVKGDDVCVLQSTSKPANDHIMELLLTVDALRRGGARYITACLPYFGYGRQNRVFSPLTPLSAQLVADMLRTAGVDRVLTVDLHAPPIKDFFRGPVDALSAIPLFYKDIVATSPLEDLVVVSPDRGGMSRARILAERISCDFVIMEKQRKNQGVSGPVLLQGDVRGRPCIILDDIVDSAGTLCQAAEVLMEKGAHSVRGYVTHGVFSPPALPCIEGSPLHELVVTDSILLPKAVKYFRKIRHLSLESLLSHALTHPNAALLV